MKFIKFVINGVVEILNIVTGVGGNGNIKDGIVGIVTVGSALALFIVFLFVLHRKTDLNYKTNILLSILFTIFVVGVVALSAIVIEKIFSI